jgi:hypothetical protein
MFVRRRGEERPPVVQASPCFRRQEVGLGPHGYDIVTESTQTELECVQARHGWIRVQHEDAAARSWDAGLVARLVWELRHSA